jgi:hypothetical protein
LATKAAATDVSSMNAVTICDFVYEHGNVKYATTANVLVSTELRTANRYLDVFDTGSRTKYNIRRPSSLSRFLLAPALFHYVLSLLLRSKTLSPSFT